MTQTKPFLRRLALTVVACGVATFLLSLLRPSSSLIEQMAGKSVAGNIMREIERATGTLSDVHPAFLSVNRAPGDAPGCLAALESAIGKRKGWTATPRHGAREVRIGCRLEGEKYRVTVTILDESRGAAPVSIVREHPSPDFRALLPPVVAIIAAFGLREVRLALALGIWLGALLFAGPGWTLGIGTTLKRYFLETVTEQFSFTILLFTLSMVGMIRIVALAGGTQGIAEKIARLASSARSGKVATALLGLAIFFDDYSNTVIVGTTMRGLTDRFRISREKLAYIIDSTSAPIAGTALVSTWIGYETALLQEISDNLGMETSGYALFLQIVPLRFYCYFTLLFVFLSSGLDRDFGPMLKAERRARLRGELLAPGARPMMPGFVTGVEMASGVNPAWFAAAVPIATVVLGTFVGMIASGSGSPQAMQWAAEEGKLSFTYLRLCFERANGGFVLLVLALTGSWVAAICAIARRIDPSLSGDLPPPPRRPLWHAALPLPLAAGCALMAAVIGCGPWLGNTHISTIAYWKTLLLRGDTLLLFGLFGALGLITAAVATARILRQRPDDPRRAIPISFPDAARAWIQTLKALLYAITILVMAWAMRKVCDDLGTSTFIVAVLGEAVSPWMVPPAIFLTACVVSFCTGTSLGTMGILIPTLLPFAYHVGGMETLLLSMGAVLDGAIFGDHCSPVSDTTVLSSTFSSCDHLDHVKTQLPYALFTAVVALLIGYLPLSARIPLPAVYSSALLVMTAFLFTVGRRVAP